ncbi:hypothetical protein HY285_03010 [Candidatus Peregrinibacteria bacterium]|nr:hypothetical protein [Candidatus Peregrinibacteria bacterium]MBI3816486.1 hypothetical protein [Candidatus Peregrinibacteria bacterium]
MGSVNDHAFTLIYEEDVVQKDIPRLPRDVSVRLRRAMEKKLTTAPNIFGKPLRRSLKNHWSLRVDDYRVIYRLPRGFSSRFLGMESVWRNEVRVCQCRGDEYWSALYEKIRTELCGGA